MDKNFISINIGGVSTLAEMENAKVKIQSELSKFYSSTDTVNKKSCMPNDVQEVIMRDGTTIVYLKDGRKGVAQKMEGDDECEGVGFCIAYYRAKYSKLGDLKKILRSCKESAGRKGYAQAILKNK